MTKLVICEKKDAAKRIASALGKYKIIDISGVKVFAVNDYIICYASGHLYNLDSNKKGYPIFEVFWKPIPKAYHLIKTIREVSRDASIFINACDFDQEGEVIAYNILRFACNDSYNKTLRAKFSSLTKDEINMAFSTLEPNIKYKGLAEAGVTRHMLDYIYGINLSRALIDASKNILSIGRVQGPTLAFIIEREIEIMLHIPKPYWVISAILSKDDEEFDARYESIVYNKKESEEIVNRCTNKDGKVKEIDKWLIYLEPPTPFNLIDLQREAYIHLKLDASKTLAIAEKLYLDALISYPRTSSQILPKINYKNIIKNLSSINSYKDKALFLLQKSNLKPRNGTKDDPAHPAIYPTGIIPKNLSTIEYKVYDLIVRRFLATFMEDAIIENLEASIDIDGYIFKSNGKRIVRESWLNFYGRYNEKTLPALNVGEIVKNIAIISNEEFTKPKPRFNTSSLLALMENEKLGTKSTRALIIDTLIKRGYITPQFKPTKLGFIVYEIMDIYMKEILSLELTREMEEKLEDIEEGSLKPSNVISDATENVLKTLNRFIENKRIISLQLSNINK